MIIENGNGKKREVTPVTHSKSVTLWCDTEDCDEWRTFAIPTVEGAVKRAESNGWSCPEWGEHHCPLHSKNK